MQHLREEIKVRDGLKLCLNATSEVEACRYNLLDLIKSVCLSGEGDGDGAGG